MDLQQKIALYHSKMERKHIARHIIGKAGLQAQATKWDLKWQRRTAKFAARTAWSHEKLGKPISTTIKKIEEVKPAKAAKETLIEPIVKTVEKNIRRIKPKEKAKKIVKTVKKRIKKKPIQETVKKSAEIKKESSFPLVESVKENEELVKEILEEIKPVEEKKAEEKTEIKKFVGHSTEISIPKPKESKGKHDWSAQRFKELDEKLKKLRRF